MLRPESGRERARDQSTYVARKRNIKRKAGNFSSRRANIVISIFFYEIDAE
jgi:hypothetical protein